MKVLRREETGNRAGINLLKFKVFPLSRKLLLFKINRKTQRFPFYVATPRTSSTANVVQNYFSCHSSYCTEYTDCTSGIRFYHVKGVWYNMHWLSSLFPLLIHM